MHIRSFLIIYFLLYSIGSYSQKIKTQKTQLTAVKNFVTHTYHVRKKDPQIKEGKYTQRYRKIIITEGNYHKNKKSGKWNFYGYDGKLNFSGWYIDGKKDSVWVYYLKDKISSKIYYNKGLADSTFGYYNDGKPSYVLKHYNNGNGLSTSYHPNGNVKEIIHLKNRKKHGSHKLFYENNQLHRENIYEESKLMYTVIAYSINGKELNGGEVKNGKGEYVNFYFPNEGKITPISINNYENGMLNGASINYWKNGNTQSEGQYKDGIAIGKWREISENGEKSSISNYDFDKIIKIDATNEGSFYSCLEQIDKENLGSFPNGINEMYKFLAKTMEYPPEARNNGINGQVKVSFTINRIGEIESYQIIRSIKSIVDNEALRVISLMPRFNPTLIHGVPVRARFGLPVNFILR